MKPPTRISVLVLTTLTLTTIITVAQTNNDPVGYFDAIDSTGLATGWAADRDVPNKSLRVVFYVNGVEYAGETTTRVFRGDVNSFLSQLWQPTAVAGLHGLSFPIPFRFRNFTNHTLYAYAINEPSGTNPNLPSPQGYGITFNSGTFAHYGIVDSENPYPSGFRYATAPSVVRYNNGAAFWHVFFCSNSRRENGTDDMDFIRYTASYDGVHDWSAPQIVRRGTNADLGACDPSVVHFRGYFYMFYTTAYNHPPNPTLGYVQVARSPTIQGPYDEILTEAGWQTATPSSPPSSPPKKLVGPKANPSIACGGQLNLYGAGMQTVVVRDGESSNARIEMWYLDDTCTPGVSGCPPDSRLGKFVLFKREAGTVEALADAAPAVTNLRRIDSMDVKYDPSTDKYRLVTIVGPHRPAAALATAESTDGGITWGPLKMLNNLSSFPDYAHNLGVEGDLWGNVFPGQSIVAFAVPQDLSPFDNWNGDTLWDLFGLLTDIRQPTTQENWAPVGVVDYVNPTTGAVTGWVYDPHTPPGIVGDSAADTSIGVHVYVDGAFVAPGATNVADACLNDKFGLTGTHRFNVQIPILTDGVDHQVHVYGIDTAGNYNPLLYGTPWFYNSNGTQATSWH